MKAMLLAAGRGERMWPLTEETPKPLLRVGGRCLIDYHLEALSKAGFSEIVINVSHLAPLIEDYVGDGQTWNCRVVFSREAEPLETAGGIVNALPLLGDGPFAVVNADTWTDYPRGRLLWDQRELHASALAHLVLVDNPPQHHRGDFLLSPAGRVALRDERSADTLTYAGLGIYHPALFESCQVGKQPLLPLLERAIGENRLAGEYYDGEWYDVGTPERLEALDARLSSL